MKLKSAVIMIILTATLLSGCSYSTPGILIVRILKNNGIKPANFLQYLKGNREYIKDIKKVESEYGHKAALEMLISDIRRYSGELDRSSCDSTQHVYRLVSYLIGRIGYVDKKAHYFRNELNKAPKSLNELLMINSSLPVRRQWKLVPVKNSLYHMQGKDGEYNLKFISSDGFCEAVYNKNGILLTEKNDPVNMGTFNYAAGIIEKNSHAKYDVDPYLQWGNSENSPQKGNNSILKGKNLAYENYLKNAKSVERYRNNVIWQVGVNHSFFSGTDRKEFNICSAYALVSDNSCKTN